MNKNNYRVAQYGNIFCIEVEKSVVIKYGFFLKRTENVWCRADVFGKPLDMLRSQPLPVYDNFQDALNVIKKLPGYVPKPVYFYPEK